MPVVQLTQKGKVYREILTEVFRFRARLLEGAEGVAGPAGLTSARWQVLGAVEESPATVAQVARALGLTRQTVQEMADAMGRDGLVAFADNPHHKRARLMAPTATARAALDRLRPPQLEFANRMSAAHSLASLRTTLDVLRASRTLLEAKIGSPDE
jgi:DNA-binding MarR family transcriptional regulator